MTIGGVVWLRDQSEINRDLLLLLLLSILWAIQVYGYTIKYL